jgi:hypothetical protein
LVVEPAPGPVGTDVEAPLPVDTAVFVEIRERSAASRELVEVPVPSPPPPPDTGASAHHGKSIASASMPMAFIPKSLLLFGFLSQLLSQLLEAGRQEGFPQGKVHRLFCRGSFHFNQLQSPLTRLVLGQGSLAPSRLDRNFTATMSPSDSLPPTACRLWLPDMRFSSLAGRDSGRVSQVPAGSFCARCLLSPRRVWPVRTVVASRPVLASPHPGGWPLSVLCNEAESSSRNTTARAFAAPGLDEQDRSHSPRVWLHDFRPIIMINSLQLTRTSQACLALSR